MAYPAPSESSDPQSTVARSAWLVSSSEQDEVGQDRLDYLVVRLGPPGPAVRGRLALFIEGAVERALDACHAPGPGLMIAPDLEAALGDQLYRARITGATGIELAFSTLRGVANLAGALDAIDSAVLRWWLAAAQQYPVRLAFADDDRFLKVYGEPVTLESLLAADAAPQTPERQMDDAFEPTDVTDVPAAVEAEEDAAFSEAARVLAEQCSSEGDTGWLHETPLHLSTPPPAASQPASNEAADANAEEACPDFSQQPETSMSESLRDDGDDTEVELSPVHAIAADSEHAKLPLPLPLESAVEADFSVEHGTMAADGDSDAPSSEAERASEPFIELAPEPDSELVERCLGWCRELEASAGPKPLSVVERQFLHAYLPLREAVDFGLAPPESRAAVEQWSSSFAHSYGEAFEALRLRGKRPTMVLDVPDLALRLARLHGARSVQLLLVDGMRFDIGLRMHERLRLLAGGNAACVERALMWAALPTKTATQVELIGRGASGLREFTGEVDDETLVARGRKAATIRRLRTGRREVYKLDLIEARLGELGGGIGAFEDLAFEVAERLASHFEGVPERTLVLVFGDHGFVVERGDDGSVNTSQGGASPEEVLVPAFAWLVGAVH